HLRLVGVHLRDHVHPGQERLDPGQLHQRHRRGLPLPGLWPVVCDGAVLHRAGAVVLHLYPEVPDESHHRRHERGQLTVARIRLERLTKSFGNVTAVKGVDLEINDGELLALLGPSGCGKTTILLMLAGIYRPTSGDIYFDDERVNDVPPKGRGVGLVFQSYALYPHMTVYDNIAFPLRLRKTPKEEIDRRVREVARIAQIEEYLQRKPSQLSGGQQQRVALCRALVKEPELLLLDEPLSNLDARLRIETRTEIKRLQRQLGITTILVTHDQIEAMTMADRVAVM